MNDLRDEMKKANHSHDESLEGISPEVARLVVQTAQRTRRDRGACVFATLMAGGGLGVLLVAALTHAVKRLGPWPVIDHAEAFFREVAQGPLATPTLDWAIDSIGWLRSGALSFQCKDEFLAEMLRVGYQRELSERLATHGKNNWVEACALHLGDFAAYVGWAQRADYPNPEHLIECSIDDAGLLIADLLISRGGDTLTRAFIASLHALGSTKGTKLPVRRAA